MDFWKRGACGLPCVGRGDAMHEGTPSFRVAGLGLQCMFYLQNSSSSAFTFFIYSCGSTECGHTHNSRLQRALYSHLLKRPWLCTPGVQLLSRINRQSSIGGYLLFAFLILTCVHRSIRCRANIAANYRDQLTGVGVPIEEATVHADSLIAAMDNVRSSNLV